MKTKLVSCLALVALLMQPYCIINFAEEQFDYVWAYYDGVAQFEQNGKIGLLDESGNILAPAEYDTIDVKSVSNMRRVWKDGKVGMLDANGELLQEKMFHKLWWLSEENGLLIFGEEPNHGRSYAGLMDINGEIIYPATWYDYTLEMIEIDYFGQPIPDLPVFLVIDDFDEGMGVLNTKGEWVIPPMGANLGFDYYEYGRLRFAYGTWSQLYYGVVDETGIIIEPVWDDIHMTGKSDLFPVCKDEKWGYVDLTGEVVIPLSWAEAFPFVEGYAEVKSEDGKWGLINTEGELVLPTIWQDSWGYSGGGAVVMDDAGKWGVVDISGNTIVDFLWDSIRRDSEKCTIVEKDGKYGFVNDNQETILPLPYDEVWRVTDTVFRASKNGACGYLNAEGTPLTPFSLKREMKFFIAEEVLDWIPCTYLGEGKGMAYINLEGEVMLEGDWGDGGPFYEGYACVRKNGKRGLIDREGNVVISLEYDSLYIEDGNLYSVTKDGVDGMIGPDFKMIAGIKE